jgi:DeoR/GlpR family transcriptional regulator of sugar metabolism
MALSSKGSFAIQAGETIILASGEKIGAASPFLVIPLDEADAIVVSAALPAVLREACTAAGVSIIDA